MWSVRLAGSVAQRRCAAPRPRPLLRRPLALPAAVTSPSAPAANAAGPWGTAPVGAAASSGAIPSAVAAAAASRGQTWSPPVVLGGVRGFYFPRRNWFPWRTRLIHQRQAALRLKRHIWPRYRDNEEAPIFGDKQDGNYISFRDKELRLGMKRLQEYARLIRNRQLQDAIDWVESMARLKSGPILKLLRKAQTDVAERHNMDPARCYLFHVEPQFGYYVKSIRKHTRARYGIEKSPRHSLLIRVREMPLEEFFHRTYIYGKVPSSLVADMRLALHEHRVSTQMMKEWAPYLNAHSRFFHRKELKWMDSTRQFDYYQARREWIQRYKANLLRASTEAREARGLPPMPVTE